MNYKLIKLTVLIENVLQDKLININTLNANKMLL
jgi:hypothetical protein